MSLNEFDIIQRYFSSLTESHPDTITGIGDDCAILDIPEGYQLAVSSDTLVSGRHFFADVGAESLGHKALAVNLSDLAAMGAKPAWVSLALTLPKVDENWLAAFARGFGKLAQQYQVQLIGGDTTSGPLAISLTVQGLVKKHRALYRSSAQAGDVIVVSGTLGDAALALKQLQNQQHPDKCLRQALEKPDPRVELGLALSGKAHSCIDISDGLLADLGHICERSKLGAEIYLQQLPISANLRAYLNATQDWSMVLSGGDDYELCFTLSESESVHLSSLSHQLGIALTVIGRMTSGSGVTCRDGNHQRVKFDNLGFQHFR